MMLLAYLLVAALHAAAAAAPPEVARLEKRITQAESEATPASRRAGMELAERSFRGAIAQGGHAAAEARRDGSAVPLSWNLTVNFPLEPAQP